MKAITSRLPFRTRNMKKKKKKGSLLIVRQGPFPLPCLQRLPSVALHA
jgi:hypothetical protein